MARRPTDVQVNKLTISFSGRSWSADRAEAVARLALEHVTRSLAQGEPFRAGRVANVRVSPVQIDLARSDDGAIARGTAANIVGALRRARRP